MTKRRATTLFICGGEETPGPRDECPERLHDYPLPSGYIDAHTVATRRLSRGWSNTRCKVCGWYGWSATHHEHDQPRSSDEAQRHE